MLSPMLQRSWLFFFCPRSRRREAGEPLAGDHSKRDCAYLRGRPVVQGILLIDINAMVFGMPRALFPAFGLTVFHGGAQTVGLWGVAITIFGINAWLPLALAMLAFAGWADIISEILRSSMLQLSLPDDLRGRITAVWLAQTNSSPPLGDLESGLVAPVTNAQISAATGGIVCMMGVLLLAWLLPAFKNYRFESTKVYDE